MARLLTKQEKENFVKNKGYCTLWYKDYLKNYEIIVLDNGDFIEINKPSVRSTLYYDDEYEAPSTALDSFISYNLFYSNLFYQMDKWIDDNKFYQENGFCIGNLLHRIGISKKQARTFVPTCKQFALYTNYQDEYYLLSDKENKEFIQIILSLKEKYIKRLNTYYKKYSHKVTTHGYWANR